MCVLWLSDQYNAINTLTFIYTSYRRHVSSEYAAMIRRYFVWFGFWRDSLQWSSGLLIH